MFIAPVSVPVAEEPFLVGQLGIDIIIQNNSRIIAELM